MKLEQEGRDVVNRFLTFIMLFFVVTISGCGGSGGGGDTTGTDSSDGNTTVQNVASLELTSDTEIVGVNGEGSATLTVRALNEDNVLVEGVKINLSATMGALSSGSVVTDANGEATFTFDSGSVSDNQIAEITAQYGDIAAIKSIEVSIDGSDDQASAVTETIIQSGVGTDISPDFTVTKLGNVVFDFFHNGESNFIVELKDSLGAVTELLVNEIGSFTGKKDVSLPPGDYHLSIQADGAWSVEITGFITESITAGSGDLPSIEILSITPSRLGLKGSGSNEIANIKFAVNGVPDGAIVYFNLDSPTGGAEIISATTALVTDGEVSVDIASGTVAGVATVTATTETASGDVTAKARVTIGGSGSPDQKHIGISAETLNIPGLIEFGIENQITAYVADRFSNPVPEGTPVYFASECGIMALEDAEGVATNLTSNFGIASATSITAAPTSDGLCRMLIWTEGEEAFTDTNGNGVYDTGEPHEGVGEPYIDANDNGSYDGNELYFDLDGDGKYTTADTTWDADTFVWTSMNVRWSSNVLEPIISPSELRLNQGSEQAFVVTVTDENGGPLPAGAKVGIEMAQVTSTESGTTTEFVTKEFDIRDAVYPGPGITEFTITMPPELEEGSYIKVIVESSKNGNTSLDLFAK